ncbi:MAG: decaprenyl-phosphate phosphoribosyltransferase [Candidatus Omnitrophota bacterium]
MNYLLISLRPQQWIKNLFIFLPLLFGKKMFVFPFNLKTALAFVLFSMISSAVYVVNDLFDIEKDKVHPTKRLRPLASGKLSISKAKTTAFILCVTAFVLSLMVDRYFGAIIIIYFIFNLFYSKWLKQEVIIDVFCISGFFLLRILAGSVIAAVHMSHWIVIMIVLLALFLGFNKRRQELRLLEHKAAAHRQILAKYNVYFIDQMIAVITSSIVVFYALYTVDARTLKEFGTTHLLYSIPFVYYGLFRYLYLIHKIYLDGDPTRILLSDRKLQINLLLWVSVCVAVIYLGF